MINAAILLGISNLFEMLAFLAAAGGLLPVQGVVALWLVGWGLGLAEYAVNVTAKRLNHTGRLGEGGLSYAQLRGVNVMLSNVALGLILAAMGELHANVIVGIALFAAVAHQFLVRHRPDMWTKLTGVTAALVLTGFAISHMRDGNAPVWKLEAVGVFFAAALFWLAAKWAHLMFPRVSLPKAVAVCCLLAGGVYGFMALGSGFGFSELVARGYASATQDVAVLAFAYVEGRRHHGIPVTRTQATGFVLLIANSVVMFMT